MGSDEATLISKIKRQIMYKANLKIVKQSAMSELSYVGPLLFSFKNAVIRAGNDTNVSKVPKRKTPYTYTLRGW